MKTARFWASVLLSLALLMLAMGVAYAFTVTVDGNPVDWGATLPSATDANEAGIVQDGRDVKEVYVTTDSTKMYFRVETWANTLWRDTPSDWAWICLNTDDNTSTGMSFPTICAGMNGIDYIVELRGADVEYRLRSCNNTTCTTVSGATLEGAFSGTTTEASVLLSQIGNLGSGCSSQLTVPVAVYWDGADNDPDDHVNDAAPFNATILCPTAVTLSSMSASANTSVPTLPFALAGLLGAGALGLFIVGRRAR